MFIQIIKADVKDAAGLRKQVEQWNEEIRPNAIGYLGGTSGVTDDGKLFVMARFESEEKAQENSNLEGQDAWWQETSQYLSDPEFINCTTVDLWNDGGSDEAGFVQVIEGDISAGRDKFLEMMRAEEEKLADERPDILGGVIAWPSNTHFIDVVYFRSEAEAREGEAASADNDEDWSEGMSNLTFLDLKEPILR